MKTEFKKCVFCEGHIKEEETIIFNGTVMCTDCYNNETCSCEECGSRIWREDAEGGSRTLCPDCYEERYTYCRGCNALIHNDDTHYYDDDEDTPYCSSCYETEDNKEIKSYNYKPEPIKYFGRHFLKPLSFRNLSTEMLKKLTLQAEIS